MQIKDLRAHSLYIKLENLKCRCQIICTTLSGVSRIFFLVCASSHNTYIDIVVVVLLRMKITLDSWLIFSLEPLSASSKQYHYNHNRYLYNKRKFGTCTMKNNSEHPKKKPKWLLKSQLWLYEKAILFQLVTMLSLEPLLTRL